MGPYDVPEGTRLVSGLSEGITNPECEHEELGERKNAGTWVGDKGISGCCRETTQKASLAKTKVACSDFYLETESRQRLRQHSFIQKEARKYYGQNLVEKRQK